MVPKWWKDYRIRKDCFHHKFNQEDGKITSFITNTLIDMGRHKLLRCTVCGKIWIF